MEAQKYSGIGIASFITSIVSGILVFLMFALAGVLEATTPGGVDEESASAVVIGLFLFASLGLSILACGLGIGGLCQKERKKLFAVLGIVFSVVTILGTVLVMIMGLVMG